MNTQETPDLFAFTNEAFNPFLTLSWRRSLSYRNHGHERVKVNVLFLYPLKTLKTPLVLLKFSGGIEREHWSEMG